MLILIPLLNIEGFYSGSGNDLDNRDEREQNNVVKYDIISALYLLLLGYNANYYYKWGVMDNICIVLLYILTLSISVFAAYLSYMCNWKGLVNNMVIKLLFALLAFMLGPFYLVWFFLVNYLGKMC
uniref:Uncharacterized protein n=1 Tax=viral metagenome TaxID=1070528 RepID=A0A6C0IBN1_9ZZZZ